MVHHVFSEIILEQVSALKMFSICLYSRPDMQIRNFLSENVSSSRISRHIYKYIKICV